MRYLLLLFFFVSCINVTFGQSVPYGKNDVAGKYLAVGSAKIYYEVYGKGKPLVLLHGGVYGYIDEFEYFIPKLAEHYQVICIATRGHGKSGIGNEPFTYQQRADDVYSVIRSITKDSVIVLGFSDGGFGALKLAATHPELVKKLIAIGVGDFPLANRRQSNYTAASLMKSDAAFFRWSRSINARAHPLERDLQMINKMYNEDIISTETFEKIKCPFRLCGMQLILS